MPPKKDPRQRKCPPGLTRERKTGRCVPQRQTIHYFGSPARSFNPLGGPTGGPASTGGGGPAPTPTPPPPPTPACVNADLFADCFTNGNDGWSVETPPGTVLFADQKVYIGSGPMGSGLPQGEIRKATPSPAGAWTMAFVFTEVANGPPTFNKIYTIGAFNGAGDAVAVLQFSGDGTGFAGDLASLYTFAWTPVQGATHSVFVQSDGVGNLTLYLDGSPVILVPFGPGPVTGAAGVMDIIITENDGFDGKGSFDSIFFANGMLPVNTDFCCP